MNLLAHCFPKPLVAAARALRPRAPGDASRPVRPAVSAATAGTTAVPRAARIVMFCLAAGLPALPGAAIAPGPSAARSTDAAQGFDMTIGPQHFGTLAQGLAGSLPNGLPGTGGGTPGSGAGAPASGPGTGGPPSGSPPIGSPPLPPATNWPDTMPPPPAAVPTPASLLLLAAGLVALAALRRRRWGSSVAAHR